MPDDKAEAIELQKKFFGKPQELATELVNICLVKPGVVYQLFALLDQYSTIDVGCHFLNNIPYFKLQMFAGTKEGMLACKSLDVSMNNPFMFLFPASYWDTKTFFSKLQLKNAIANPISIQGHGNGSGSGSGPRQLSQTEIDYYKAKAKKNGEKFNDAVIWELPEKGTGFVVYNRNDLKGKKDTYGYDQIGTKETVEAMIKIAKEWNTLHPDKLLQIGDMSRPGGIDTPDHAGHQNGKIIDVRPVRNDSLTGAGAQLTYKSASYHRDLTKDLIRLVRKLHPSAVVRFNDGEIIKEKEFSFVIRDGKGIHDNHLHFEL